MQASKTDAYFLDSASATSYFFEEKAFNEDGTLRQAKGLSINKIGHGAYPPPQSRGFQLVGGGPRASAPTPPRGLLVLPTGVGGSREGGRGVGGGVTDWLAGERSAVAVEPCTA